MEDIQEALAYAAWRVEEEVSSPVPTRAYSLGQGS